MGYGEDFGIRGLETVKKHNDMDTLSDDEEEGKKEQKE